MLKLGFFRKFVALPMPIQLAMGVGSMGLLGIIMLALFLKGSTSTPLIFLIAVGIVLAVAAIGLYGFIQKRKAERRGKEFSADMRTISGTGDKAKDASFSRAFEEGIEKYQRTGKKLWDQPWYLVIGEPSSGKTKAIKRTVRFDNLLTQAYQGSGGTQNMDWWFAEQAVILDTAGKLAFPENRERVSTGWPELLKRLKKCRPIAPINGVILFISAESLQEKTPEQIQEEARVANMRLREIHRDLGVRFPVWVIVSKADTITGFREMIHEMGSAEAQHQILGWSNPVAISSQQSDQPFDARRVRDHIDDVASRVEILRRSMLQNPIPRNIAMDENARRLDEVDELYQLPEALRRIGYRLQLYLEEAMSQGVSGAPLFMRGIYFTSAEQKGDVLDLLLAEELDIPVKQLRRPVGDPFSDDPSRDQGTPFFLKDLFERKIFEERGLVTAQRSVGKAEARRRIWLIGGIAASAIAVTALGWWASGALEKKMGARSAFWTRLEASTARNPVEQPTDDDRRRFRLVSPATTGGYEYAGAIEFDLPQDPGVGGQLQLVEPDQRQAPHPRSRALPDDPARTLGFQIPLRTFLYAGRDAQPEGQPVASAFFAPARALSGDPFENQRDAHFSILHDTVLGPAIHYAGERFASPDSLASINQDLAADALAELLRLRHAIEKGVETSPPRIEPLVRFVADPADDPDVPPVAEQLALVQEAIDNSYRSTSSWPDARAWPDDQIKLLQDTSVAVDKAVAWFVEAQKVQREQSKSSGPWKALTDLQNALVAYRDAEAKLLGISWDVDSARDFEARWVEWKSAYDTLRSNRDALQVALRAADGIELSGGTSLGASSIADAETIARGQVLDGPRARYDLLLHAAIGGKGPPTPSITDGIDLAASSTNDTTGTGSVDAARHVLENGWREFARLAEQDRASSFKDLASLSRMYLGDGPLRDAARFQDRFAAVTILAAQLGVDQDDSARAFASRTVGGDGPLQNVRGRLDAARAEIDNDPLKDPPTEAGELAARLVSPDAQAPDNAASTTIARMLLAIGRYRTYHVLTGVLDAILPQDAIGPAAPDSRLALAIGRRVEAMVGEDRAPRPAIAFTRMGENQFFEDRFHPRRAPLALAAFDEAFPSSSDAATPRAQPLDAATIAERQRLLRQYRDAYREAYVQYWSRDVFADLEIDPSSLTIAEVARVAQRDADAQIDHLATLIESARQALAPIDPSRGQGASAIADHIAGRYRRAGAAAFDEWADLAKSSGTFEGIARRLRSSPDLDEALKDLLPTLIFETPDTIRAAPEHWNYWAGVLTALIRHVGDAGFNEQQSASRAIGSHLERFPFRRRASSSIPPDQLIALASSIRNLAPGSIGTTPMNPAWPAGVTEGIKRLLGEGVARPDGVEKAQAILDLLIGPDPASPSPLRLQIGLSNLVNYPEQSAHMILRDGADETRNVRDYDLGSRGFAPIGTVSADTGQITFTFDDASRASLNGDWAILRALLAGLLTDAQGNPLRDGDGQAISPRFVTDGGYWLVPVQVLSQSGARVQGSASVFHIAVRPDDDARAQKLQQLFQAWPE